MKQVDMITLGNGTQVPLLEFIEWNIAKQTHALRTPEEKNVMNINISKGLKGMLQSEESNTNRKSTAIANADAKRALLTTEDKLKLAAHKIALGKASYARRKARQLAKIILS